ncbi:MAG: hypothetical protein JST00_21480 [Deltaproteobacteria bacterium]|nr:hypothetical protein [Deltaproteobacteria bacterium]
MKAKPLVSPGACIAVSLGPRRFGACRVTGSHDGQPVAEIVAWVGERVPSLDDIRRAKRTVLARDTADFEKGPMRYAVMDSPERLPKGFSLVGHEPKVVRKGAPPHLGLWWVDFRKAVVVAAALVEKGDPKRAIRRDDERDARERARRAGLTLATWRLREDAREVASMWRSNEYDNVADVVSDLVALVPKVARLLPKEAAALERVRLAVMKDVESLSREPSFARAAKAWSKALLALRPERR